MSNSKLILRGVMHAVGVAVYVFLVAFLMSNGEQWFGKVEKIYGPFFILMLLVFSVAIVGSLIFGKPILLYWDNQKKEAVKLLGYTLGWLLIIIAITLAVMVF